MQNDHSKTRTLIISKFKNIKYKLLITNQIKEFRSISLKPKFNTLSIVIFLCKARTLKISKFKNITNYKLLITKQIKKYKYNKKLKNSKKKLKLM